MANTLKNPFSRKYEIGMQNGNWILISRFKGNKRTKYVIQCKCGNQVIVASDVIARYLEINTQRKHIDQCRKCTNQVKNRKLGISQRKSPGFSTVTAIFSNYRGRAKKLDLEFSLTREQFTELIFKACFYCGRAGTQSCYAGNLHRQIAYNGIDRKDSSLGYTLLNCVTCCKTCNYGKSNLFYDEWIEYLDALVSYRKELKNGC
jgi:hypothetical protein